ncbi:hypothetical protein GCM10009087_54720 [Sphingomonas oligophenolica]
MLDEIFESFGKGQECGLMSCSCHEGRSDGVAGRCAAGNADGAIGDRNAPAARRISLAPAARSAGAAQGFLKIVPP